MMSMTVAPTAEDILALHPKIRWAGLASERGEVIWMVQRPGVTSFSPENTDKGFVQMGPLVVNGVCERLSPWTGRVGNIIIEYEKVTSLIARIAAGYLCMTIEKEDSRNSVQNIAKSIEKWKS